LIRGCDVSRHQGLIDWRLLSTAVEVALIRASLGKGGVDDMFARNWENSASAGLVRRGVYHYYITEDNPQAQVANVFRVTQGDFGTEPFTLDCERRRDEVSKPFDKVRYSLNVKQFVDEWQASTSHPLRIYTSAVEWAAITTLPLWVRSFGLHVAQYNAHITEPDIPFGWADWEVWQYSASGHLPGVAASVDLNWVKPTVEEQILAHVAAIQERLG
jgi:lysozyme